MDGVVGFLVIKNLPEFLASLKMQVVEAVSEPVRPYGLGCA